MSEQYHLRQAKCEVVWVLDEIRIHWGPQEYRKLSADQARELGEMLIEQADWCNELYQKARSDDG